MDSQNEIGHYRGHRQSLLVFGHRFYGNSFDIDFRRLGNYWIKLKLWTYDISNFDKNVVGAKMWEITQLENENLKVSSRKSKQSVYVYVVPTQHKKRIKLNANPLMQYARIDTALQPLHTCFFVTLFFTHVFSSVLMFQIRYENHGLPISWVSQNE